MLKLEHVKKTFNKGSANEVILYRDLNVEIHDGEFVTIIGSNGSGTVSYTHLDVYKRQTNECVEYNSLFLYVYADVLRIIHV